MLFTLLFFQIAVHQGADHYRWEQLPHWWDWFAFAGANVIRAADLCDVLDSYGWTLHSIQPASHLTRVSLIAFNL
ncbi:hypothetical protein Q8G71_36620, partial [Klebsiella pneumoniae]